MREISRNVPFFIYFERYYGQHKQFCVLTRTWTIEGPNATKEVVRSSHPPLEAITFDHRKKEIIASPFKATTDRHQPVDKVIEQNNYTNQCLNVIGKQLDRIEDRIENKVILQPGNSSKPIQALEKPLVKLPTTRHTSLSHPKDKTALEIVAQKLEELVKKEPATPSTNVLNIQTSSSNSSQASDQEFELLETQFQDLEVKRLYHPDPTSSAKNWYPKPSPPDLRYEERNVGNQFSVSEPSLARSEL